MTSVKRSLDLRGVVPHRLRKNLHVDYFSVEKEEKGTVPLLSVLTGADKVIRGTIHFKQSLKAMKMKINYFMPKNLNYKNRQSLHLKKSTQTFYVIIQQISRKSQPSLRQSGF